METDLTISEVAADPLIAMMIEADGVSIEDLKMLLQTTAKLEVERLRVHLHERHAADFYERLDEKARAEEISWQGGKCG
jgi:serine kinase of HPr protein (carbohydrate metabolism regulator)